MNERIRELVKKAGLDDPMCPIDEWDNPELEKFAELLVGECIDKIKNADMTDLEGPDPDDVLWLVEKQIKQHFGVE